MTEKKRPAGWKPGQSGNPSGRPRGVGDVARLRKAIADRVPELITHLLEKALAGDVGAARLLLERAIAPLKAIEPPVAVKLPAGTLTQQGQAVMASLSQGALAPSQALQLLSGLAAMATLVSTDELARRIAALEEQHDKQEP